MLCNLWNVGQPLGFSILCNWHRLATKRMVVLGAVVETTGMLCN